MSDISEKVIFVLACFGLINIGYWLLKFGNWVEEKIKERGDE